MALSAIMEMEMRAGAIPDVASLSLGLPSFNTPASIIRHVNQRLQEDADIGKYTLSDGLPELREHVAAFHQSRTGVVVDADRNVVITAGNMQGLNVLLHALVDPGDEIIITDPGFASHVQQIVLCGGTPVYWKLDEAAGWTLDVEGLSGLITDRTKAIILVSPSNPTGKIFTEAQLRRVGEIARKHGLMVMLDDPYCHFTYENSDRYFNLSSVRELADHTAYLYTFSKAHAMTGWRLGYMVVPEQLKHEVLKVHDATLICAPRISQIAGLAALSEYEAYLPELQSILSKRRQLICERLDRLPHVFSYSMPEGAYYVFPKIVAGHSESCAFSLELLQSARVSVTPGSAFGPAGEHHVRMAYCVATERIE
ncbi:MAG: pyridoxal phosphate-dependent aminotransferase, partial [Rhizobiales bacterium]|nr:pyridoxal phosphate-dependent aminotransferase [Hyphomicrobiales bacterium]